MAANGISTLANKADRKAAKLALADTKRSTANVTVTDGTITWTDQGTNTQVSVAWTSNTVYALNAVVGPLTVANGMGGRYYKATIGGTSGVTQPAWQVTNGYRPLNTLNVSLTSPTVGRPWQT